MIDATDHTLYDGGRAPNPRRVAMYLAEREIKVTLQRLDMGALDHQSETISALNPLMQLPILKLPDGEILSETIAICRYFDGLYPGSSLFGHDYRSLARIEMWQRRVELQWLYPIAQAFRHIHPAMIEWEKPQIAAWGEANKPKAQKFAALLNEQLGKSAFVAGDTFSIADITAIIAMDFSRVARIKYAPELQDLHRWAEKIRARESHVL